MEGYSVPREAQNVFLNGIIFNPLHSSAPEEIKEAAQYIEYIGSSSPSIPINWRFAESIAALKGFEGAMLNVLLKKKYGIDYQEIGIHTDHVQLFIMSTALIVIDPQGANIERSEDRDAYEKFYPNGDFHRARDGSHFKAATTNIYKTKDGRYFHLHGGMNPAISQQALGLDPASEVPTWEEACAVHQEKVVQHTAAELDTLLNEVHRQAATVCWSAQEYKESEHGRANAHVGLFEVHHVPNPKQAPDWWTPVDGHTSPARPLFGLKVLDLTRIIAAPALTRDLAELGASVLRVTSPNVPDMTHFLADTGWGKWNAHLDLTKAEDRARLRELVEESDVVVDGYRPGVMEKWGFGKDDILDMFKDKEKGVIYARVNCYGWNGPWSYKAGWQQISDANCGISLEYGRALGTDEALNPVFPNADFCTGVAGATGVLQAIIERSEKGGSYVVDVALNYYNQWLVNSCSTYPPEVWDALWASYGCPLLQHTDNNYRVLPIFVQLLMQNNAPSFNPIFLETRDNKAIGVPVGAVQPIFIFAQQLVKPRFNIGSRGNGADKPRWPEDLLTEII
ncbi:CoA-transferase family III domain-containing protein [Pholiota molesta]|nr:CoA-transferase family III domain-containing protein [Pholiota molesta]